MRYAEAYLKESMPIAALYALMQSGSAVKTGRGGTWRTYRNHTLVAGFCRVD